jgi:sterol desaturase/sphingolipid hydroxylase (fatty acid hydroxylase superfamily)
VFTTAEFRGRYPIGALRAILQVVNFAVHLPLLDRVFGTQHLPGNDWPGEYGIDGHPVPEGWFAQLVSPFGRRPR